MSVVAALMDMFSCVELTTPVTLGAASARGLYDESGELVPFAGEEIQRIGPVLFLRKDSLAGLVAGVSIQLGALGGANGTSDGRVWKVHGVDPMQDGLIVACRLGGGR